MKYSIFSKYVNNSDRLVYSKILEVLPDEKYKIILTEDTCAFSKEDIVKIVDKSDLHKITLYIGANPFKNQDFWRKFERRGYDLEGILLDCGIYAKDEEYRKDRTTIDGVEILEINDKPFVYDKDGKRLYYQRDYVWSLRDEQLFIESIYNGLDCGKIVLRMRSWDYLKEKIKKGDTEGLAFMDVVDGKQRLHTLKRFLNDEFTDLEGHYYSDLSKRAQREFENSNCLCYLRLGEHATDEDVIKTFLMVNFSGKPMTQEHLDYVKEIGTKI